MFAYERCDFFFFLSKGSSALFFILFLWGVIFVVVALPLFVSHSFFFFRLPPSLNPSASGPFFFFNVLPSLSLLLLSLFLYVFAYLLLLLFAALRCTSFSHFFFFVLTALVVLRDVVVMKCPLRERVRGWDREKERAQKANGDIACSSFFFFLSPIRLKKRST